jgi:hypothetical protein
MSDDAFENAMTLVRVAVDPKVVERRLKELQGARADVDRAEKKLAADKEAVETELANKRAACDADCTDRRAAMDRLEKHYAQRGADLKDRESRFADQIAYSNRVIERYNGFWRHKMAAELGGAAEIASLPSFWAPAPDEPEPDAHYRDVEGGEFHAEATQTSNAGDAFPKGISLTRSIRRGAEL